MDIKYQGGLLGLKELANSNIGKKAIQKASDFLDDVDTVTSYGKGLLGLKDLAQREAEYHAKYARFGSDTLTPEQEIFSPVNTEKNIDLAMNYGPQAMAGTIVGKGALGWNKLGGKFSNMFDKLPRAEISDVGSKFTKEYIDSGRIKPHTLGEISDLKVFKQYPWTKDITIRQENIPKNDMTYNSADGSIVFSDKRDMPNIKDLLHEVQHAIQEKEGFAKGGAPQDDLASMAHKKIGELVDASDFKKLALSKKIPVESAIKSYEKTNGVKVSDFVKQVAKNNTEEQIQAHIKNFSKDRELFSYEGYLKIPGEIEARSVASRSNIPQDQLKYSQPYAGENIPLKEWINASDYLDGGVQASFTKPAPTGFRRAIPLIKQGLITQEQIPIMKEIGLFNKPVEFQTDFIKNMGEEMRYVQNKAHIEGWDKARTTQAYKDMADRFTADKVSQGTNQITASQFLDLP